MLSPKKPFANGAAKISHTQLQLVRHVSVQTFAGINTIGLVTRKYAAFLSVSVVVGTSPLLAAIAFAALSNIMIPLTHYGGGAAPILYGAGFVTQGKWWQLGFIMVTINLIIWLGISSLRWKAIGLR